MFEKKYFYFGALEDREMLVVTVYNNVKLLVRTVFLGDEVI